MFSTGNIFREDAECLFARILFAYRPNCRQSKPVFDGETTAKKLWLKFASRPTLASGK
jgi:hypothetical protein